MDSIKTIHVEVKKDHLDKVSNGKPIPSLSELIWNSLDGDANNVNISFNEGVMGVDEIVIQDNGIGIPHKDAGKLFGSLGGSWKKLATHSKTKNRFLHGQEGKGRFKAFALGRIVEWNIVYKDDTGTFSYKVTSKADRPDYFDITAPKKLKSGSTGVTVKISELIKQFKMLDADYAIEKLSPVFAIYLTQYRDCQILVSGRKLDPSELILASKEIDLGNINYEGKDYKYSLKIIEWSVIFERDIHLCNSHGFPLERLEKKLRGTGEYSYSAYLKSEHISKLNQRGLLSLAELEPSLKPIIEKATSSIKQYFIDKKLEESKGLIDSWIQEEVYPYQDENMSPVDEAEKKIFDIVAINVAENIPEFEKGDKKSKAFQLRLLKQAVEKSPEELQLIVSEVLQLPKDKQSELAELLKETSLSSIISASKTVTDRLKFLAGLDSLIFNSETKQNLKERSQLHRILAENTWVFGDAFSLSVDDKSLTQVLVKHKQYLYEELVIDKPVKRLDGKTGIIDLMLSRAIARNHPDEREHLVIELKAPSVKIGKKEIGQIEDYAFAVADDERFRHLKTKWTFCVVSNDLNDYAKRKRSQKAYTDGVIYQSDESGVNITILVKTWSEILQECKHRMEFIRNQLNINIDTDQGLTHLKERYQKYTKGVLFEEEAEV